MRCKCGYNSFDHNRACPKCRKDVSAIRRQLNLTMPEPGSTSFFVTASQRSVYPEPLLGDEGMPGQPMGAAPFAAAAVADASPFGGIPTAPDASYGGAPFGGGVPSGVPFGGIPTAPDASPFGGAPVQQPMGQAPQAVAAMPMPAPVPAAPQPPIGAGMVDDIFPVEDDSLDDIVPIEDEIVPIEEAAPVYQPQPAMAAPALNDEIEVELDAFEDSYPTPAPAPAAEPNSPMAQIKSTLAETGDLAAQAVSAAAPVIEAFEGFGESAPAEAAPQALEAAPDFGETLDLQMEEAPAAFSDEPAGLQLEESPLALDDASLSLSLDDEDFQLDAEMEQPMPSFAPPAAMPEVMAVEPLDANLSADSTLTDLQPQVQPQAEGDDLASLVDELDLDELDGDL